MKPNTNFRTVPVTERLPKQIINSEISEEMFVEDIKGNGHYANYYFRYNYWVDYNSKEMIKHEIKFFLEEIPEQAEHENPFCQYCGNFKRMPGNDLIVPLCICTDWSKPATDQGENEIPEDRLREKIDKQIELLTVKRNGINSILITESFPVTIIETFIKELADDYGRQIEFLKSLTERKESKK